MTLLDRYVDELEHAIDIHGVEAVDPRTIAPNDSIELPPHLSRAAIVVEMLRVWMEHRWSAGIPTTADECLQMFPEVSFTTRDISELRSEETRQRSLHAKKQSSSGHRSDSTNRAPAFPSIGERWCGFELLAILGTGAIAQVYLAKQPDLASRLVALKLTHRESFESYWLATLQHSSIVPVYSTHVDGELYGICMPYLGNTTLQDVKMTPQSRVSTVRNRWWKTDRASNSAMGSPISSTIRMRYSSIDTVITSFREQETGRLALDDPLAKKSQMQDSELLRDSKGASTSSQNTVNHERLVLKIGLQLADALVHAHSAGIIHSDIKPANVLLSNEGEPRLIDFNVSYRQKGVDHRDMEPLGGTLPYMSPELKESLQNAALASKTVDHRTDIYSLGMVMTELLCGQLLSEREFRLWQKSHKWNGNISPAVGSILLKCIANNLSDRYETTQQLSDDLRAHLEHRPLRHAPEPSLLERCLKWGYRHPRIASSATSLIASLMVIAGLVVGTVSANRALESANWQNRLSQLQSELPHAFSLVTSLDVTPELEKEARKSVDKSIELVSSPDAFQSSLRNIDPRWNSPQHGSNIELHSQWIQLVSLAKSQRWSTPPSALDSIQISSVEKVESANGSHHDRAIKDVMDANYPSAIESLLEQTRQNPRDYFAWWLLGDSYLAIQDWSRAEQAYTVCASLRPEIAVVYFNRGIVRFATQHFHDAEMDYDQVLRLAPQWYHCRLNKALCLQSMGRFQEAIDELAEAIRNDYKTVSVYRLQSILYMQLGDATSSTLAANQALELAPTTEAQWIDRGLLELPTDPNKAVESFRQALQLNPRSSDARQKLAYVYAELLHDTDASLEQLDALIEILPQYPVHRAGRAVLHARRGDSEKALRDVAELEKMSSLEPLVRYQVACVYSLLGRHTLSQNDSDKEQKTVKEGMKWLRNATLLDSSFIEIANSDPDLEWLRGNPSYSQWIEVVRSYHQP